MKVEARWVKRAAVLAFLLAVASPALPQSEQAVSGFGGFPISRQLTSMWLVGPEKRPLLMVYFHGPDDWHKSEWKFNSKFDKGKPGWAEFKSDKAILRLWLDTDTGKTEVQSAKFNIKESNTFLVTHVGEPTEKVSALGTFELPISKEEPAAVLLLRAHPELLERMQSAISTVASK